MSHLRISVLLLVFSIFVMASAQSRTTVQPWSHGPLRVSGDGRYLQHADGTDMFWLANTAWLLPQKLNRQDACRFLDRTARAGYNAIQIQVLNDVPSTNTTGHSSHPDGWNMAAAASSPYWDNIDYIVDESARRGLYVGMVCIWGSLVKSGKMDENEAVAYGRFLAGRYRARPNIVWIIGGDTKGDTKPEVWDALARTIKENDPGHLMTFHPFGRTSSADWWHTADWLDFNMFQSGHRRYDQKRGDGDDAVRAAVAEDSWRYAADALQRLPAKPVLDGEPSYEDIPQGLHDITQPRWQAHDVRRYAYWSVFSGSCGHCYGHNSIMQFFSVGDNPAYGAEKTWQQALDDQGFNQMQHLRHLVERFPARGRVPDQSVLTMENGERYNRAVAMRGPGWIMAYTYTNQPLEIDLSSIPGTKYLYWMDPRTGGLEPLSPTRSSSAEVRHDGPSGPGEDWVFIASATQLR